MGLLQLKMNNSVIKQPGCATNRSDSLHIPSPSSHSNDHHRIHNSSPLVLFLCETNRAHIFTSYFVKNQFTYIILVATCLLPTWSLSFCSLKQHSCAFPAHLKCSVGPTNLKLYSINLTVLEWRRLRWVGHLHFPGRGQLCIWLLRNGWGKEAISVGLG